MSDLVKRLRSVDISWSETGEWCAEAADRIEALEAALRIVVEKPKSHESYRVAGLTLGAEHE